MVRTCNRKNVVKMADYMLSYSEIYLLGKGIHKLFQIPYKLSQQNVNARNVLNIANMPLFGLGILEGLRINNWAGRNT